MAKETRRKYDWERIRFEFVHDNTLTLADLARGVGASYATVHRRAVKEGWVQERTKYLSRVNAEANETAKSRDVEKLTSLQRTAEEFAEVLKKVTAMAQQVNEMVEDAGEGRAALVEVARPVSDLARAIKDAATFTRSLFDIPTEAELEARELSKKRLELERKKLEETLKDKDQSAEITVLIRPAEGDNVEDYAR